MDTDNSPHPIGMLSTHDITSAILASVEGKYRDVSVTSVSTIVEEALTRWGRETREDAIFVDATPTFDLRTDVLNQARVYLLIENVWRLGRPLDRGIERIQAIVRGTGLENIAYRDTRTVEDFDGEIPTRVEDIPAKLQALNGWVSNVDALKIAATDHRAAFLAKLFAEIIRVHPFRDGNGRTARLTVQYCLRRWGRRLLSIPKVRNDADWKLTLSGAMEGDYTGLTIFFRGNL